MAWEANMDMQPVFNQYKTVAYMRAYLSKSESECSVERKQAVQHAFEKKLDSYEQMKSVAYAYINKRDCSIHECVYHILPEQWLRKNFLGVIFTNSNVPEKRFRVVDRFIDRPYTRSSGAKLAVLDTLSFDEFSRYYYLPSNPKYKENDYQPEEPDHESILGMSNIGCANPKQIILLPNEKLKCHKIP